MQLMVLKIHDLPQIVFVDKMKNKQDSELLSLNSMGQNNRSFYFDTVENKVKILRSFFRQIGNRTFNPG
jgi:hypothetical protein